MVRHSLSYVPGKLRKEIAADLKHVCTGAIVDELAQRLGVFDAMWDKTHLPICHSLRWNWARMIPRSSTTHPRFARYQQNEAIESVNMSLRKITKMNRLAQFCVLTEHA